MAQSGIPPRGEPIGDEWLDVNGAADYVKLSVDSIYDAVRAGGLRHVRVGGRLRLRIKKAWLDAWMEQFAIVNPVR
jgi:excisionase family DNA binding protein